MVSEFKLIPSKYFLKQLENLNEKNKRTVEKKLEILKNNPFRYKPLSGYKHLFEVKMDVSNQYSRLIYAVFYPSDNSIRIFGIFDRGNNFKDFHKIFEEELKKIRQK